MNQQPYDENQQAELEAFAEALHADLASERWQGWEDEQLPTLPLDDEVSTSSRSNLRWAIAATLLIAVALRPWFGAGREAVSDTSYRVSLAQREGMGNSEFLAAPALQSGQLIETSADMVARIEVPELGEVQLDPGSRLRVGDASSIDGEHFLELEQGAATAAIFAAPRRFQLGTPAGIAVDLGCVYRAEVTEDGTTHVAVLAGAVSLEAQDRKVYVPQGASVWATPAAGPGTPIWDDADQELREMIRRLDQGEGLRIDSDEFQALFDHARPSDALSVWHLMVHAEGGQRFVYAKLLDRLVPMPEEYEAEECVEVGTAGHAAWRARQPWI